MFEDFDQSATSVRARKQFQRSLFAAAVLCVTSSAAIVAASKSITKVVEDEPLIAVQLPPSLATTAIEPAPPPPTIEVKDRLKPPIKKRTPRTPKAVPVDKPAESDVPLIASAGGSGEGPVDGTGIGIASVRVEPPPPPPPQQPPEKLVRPIVIHTDDRPRYPLAARRKGIEGIVVVAFDVLEDGRVANMRVVSGPKELHAAVLEAASFWRFKPARRGGKPVRYPMTKAVIFRLEEAG